MEEKIKNKPKNKKVKYQSYGIVEWKGWDVRLFVWLSQELISADVYSQERHFEKKNSTQ